MCYGKRLAAAETRAASAAALATNDAIRASEASMVLRLATAEDLNRKRIATAEAFAAAHALYAALQAETRALETERDFVAKQAARASSALIEARRAYALSSGYTGTQRDPKRLVLDLSTLLSPAMTTSHTAASPTLTLQTAARFQPPSSSLAVDAALFYLSQSSISRLK